MAPLQSFITVAALSALAGTASANNLRATRQLAHLTPSPELDVAIANFALNLECLEAEFYSWAAYGEGLNEEQRGGGPMSTGGQMADLSGSTRSIAKQIADHEIKHVELLRAALGDAAVECPKMDIGPAFAAAADAAVGITLDPPFSPYTDDYSFLLGAFVFEDVGVTAYNGAAPLITDKGILGAAAAILAVEAYHGGGVRMLLSEVRKEIIPAYGVAVGDVANAITNLRAVVGNGGEGKRSLDNFARRRKSDDLMKPAFIAPVDEAGIAEARTPEEVLAIVYLGDAAVPGGFFPEGLSFDYFNPTA